MRVNSYKFAKDSSIRATLLRVKFNNALENHWKPLLALISVRILLKQLDYSLSISMRRQLIRRFGLINYHTIEISSS